MGPVTSITSAIPDLLVTGAGVGLGGAGGFWIFNAIKWGAEAIFGRIDRREAALDEGVKDLIANLRAEIGRLSDRLVAAEGKIGTLSQKLTDCEEKHIASQAEVARLSATMQGYGDARNRVQAELAVVGIAGREVGQ